METLTCESCNKTWERERVRGRKPKQCPDCREKPTQSPQEKKKQPDKAKVAKQKEPALESISKPPVKKRRGKTAYEKLAGEVDHGPLHLLPFTSRPSGWCTDYDPLPEAQHEKCDGDLGKYRCPCDCHGWKD